MWKDTVLVRFVVWWSCSCDVAGLLPASRFGSKTCLFGDKNRFLTNLQKKKICVRFASSSAGGDGARRRPSKVMRGRTPRTTASTWCRNSTACASASAADGNVKGTSRQPWNFFSTLAPSHDLRVALTAVLGCGLHIVALAKDERAARVLTNRGIAAKGEVPTTLLRGQLARRGHVRTSDLSPFTATF